MLKVKCVTVDGICFEVSYELINGIFDRIQEIKLNSIDKDIFDVLSVDTTDEIEGRIMEDLEGPDTVDEAEGVR